MVTIEGCDAPRTSCGTPSGWRAGGRCPGCRAAKNRDDAKRRGLTDEQRNLALRSLRSGGTAASAAEAAGVSPQSLSQAARADSELRAALDGAPEAIQVIAQRGDWLAALVRSGGDQKAAALAIGINPNTPNSWRQRDPEFDAVVMAMLAWIDTAGARTVRRRRADGRNQGVTIAELDEAASYLESGATISEASRRTGMAGPTLIKRAADSHRLSAALAARTRQPVTEGMLTAAARHLERGGSLAEAARLAATTRDALLKHAPGHDRLRAALEAYKEQPFPEQQ
ncbi:hypothetical protein E6R18_25310 [Streptomyces sp. A1277]|uniref:hypothetical protein n=1 Tax=Streptomyces sp. A1277 TaxID=2563103 RepID=UPI0010A272E5|nr:hypothetical protein [Streptomyces sp. A1277]THA29227.1 hypothetical protein E6R18_25310 [Streptomyces sp. A1277]